MDPTSNRIRLTKKIALVSLAIFFADASHSTVIPIFPGFAQDIGASLSMLGSYGSASALTMLLFSFPLGRLSDRYGRKKMMIPGLVLMVIVSFSYMLASSPIHLYPIRMILGLSLGLTFGNGFLLMTEISDPENRNMAQGLYMTSMGIGFTVGPLIGGFTAKFYGSSYAFMISSGFGTLSLLILYFVNETRDKPASKKDVPASFFTSIRNPKIFAGGVANFLNSLMYNAVTLFFPVYGAGLGFDESQIGTAFTARGLSSTGVGSWVICLIHDHIQRLSVFRAGLGKCAYGVAGDRLRCLLDKRKCLCRRQLG
jgi:MFS family permease